MRKIVLTLIVLGVGGFLVWWVAPLLDSYQWANALVGMSATIFGTLVLVYAIWARNRGHKNTSTKPQMAHPPKNRKWR